MTITILEMQICQLWINTANTEGCLAAIETLQKLQAYTEQEVDLVVNSINLAFAKGNLYRIEARA